MKFPEFRSSDWFDTSGPAYLIILLVGAMLAGVSASSVGQHRASPSNMASCTSLEEKDKRLACYDYALHRSPSQPVSGANASVRARHCGAQYVFGQ